MENFEPAIEGGRGGSALASAAEAPARANPAQAGGLELLREWGDALLIAFVLAMFVRVFMIELFKIPTGSMTPTLIGGDVAEVDYNGDGKKDLLVMGGRDSEYPLLFLNQNGRYAAQGPVRMTWDERENLRNKGEIHTENDRILVNKFAYWFHPPRRGDIVVFKVPEKIWKADQPIYIKRCSGEPGDKLSFDRRGGLVANGKPVTQPPFFQTQRYETSIDVRHDIQPPESEIEYDVNWRGEASIRRMNVAADKIFVFGDNAHSSLDSRYWGGVPLDNLKGRAFFRYWPITKMSFLHSK